MKTIKTNTALIWNTRLTANEYTQYRMPWGRYRGQMIRDLPTSYIQWGIMNLDQEIATKFAREIQRRGVKLPKI